MSETEEKSMSEETSKLEIPEETIKEIMFLLPVKSLLKFRCVSPSWLSFIDSPYFLKAHMSKSTPKIILHARGSSFTLDIDTVNPKPKAHATTLDLVYPLSNTFIFGSCNGVLLSHSKDKNPLVPFYSKKDVVLQNPSTRTYHNVPCMGKVRPMPKDFDGEPVKVYFDLGYDDLTDDYKVFRNCEFSGVATPFYSHVTVYSMKEKSFKTIEPLPYYIRTPLDASVFVGGALHWVVSTGPLDESQWIASFDVATEKYRLVDQPVYSSEKFELHPSVLGGCLTIACNCFDLEIVEVWVMKEYGSVESWSKILSIGAADIDVESICVLRPLLYSECGKKLLIAIDCATLLWYDLEKKSAEIVQLDFHNVPEPEQFLSFLHLETLVKLHGPGPWEEKRVTTYNDEKQKKVPKKRDDFLSKGFRLKL